MKNTNFGKTTLVSILLIGSFVLGSGSQALAKADINSSALRQTASAEVTLDTTAPEVTISSGVINVAKVKKGYQMQVSFSGMVSDYGSGPQWPSKIEVIDEYGQVSKVINPVFAAASQSGAWSEGWDANGSAYNGYIMIEAWADGWDRDGRTYTIRHTAVDNAGNAAVAEVKLTVVHQK